MKKSATPLPAGGNPFVSMVVAVADNVVVAVELPFDTSTPPVTGNLTDRDNNYVTDAETLPLQPGPLKPAKYGSLQPCSDVATYFQGADNLFTTL